MQQLMSYLFNIAMMVLTLLPFAILGLMWIITAKAWTRFKRKNPYVDLKD